MPGRFGIFPVNFAGPILIYTDDFGIQRVRINLRLYMLVLLTNKRIHGFSPNIIQVAKKNENIMKLIKQRLIKKAYLRFFLMVIFSIFMFWLWVETPRNT